MKKITISFICFLVFLIINSCSKTEDLQDDPNRATEVSPELLLTNIEIQAFNNISLSAALASRYLTYTNGVNSNQYYNWQRAGYDDYDNLKQVSKMMEEAQRTESGVYQILGKFFNSYFIISLTEVFGDVPYSDAIQATENNYTPVYDTQKSIYLKVLNDLKDANNELATNEETILGDIIYNGDKLKWRKLINSYYLRILMNLSIKEGNDELNIVARFNEVYTNPGKYPIFESNEDNAALNYYNIQDNRYPLQNNNDLQTAYYMEESFVERLQNFEDPRLFAFAEKKPNAADLPNTDFSAYGGLYGSGDLNDNTSKAVAGEASRVHPRYFTDPENEPSLLISYSELEFILAEAVARNWISADIDIHYKNGISASMEFYNISNFNDYLNNPDIQLSPGNEIETILTQKHISMFLNTGWQIFYEQRRTGFPEFNTDGEGILNNAKIPKRWMYPADEAVNNGNNLTDAIQRQYPNGDNTNAEMWLLQ
ncbi:SusD/RagB family nutrient-binding outer membrane lipoprotein [Galbibacter sp. PAP.153]|uniref:SusD/RagB family nutrient-binding outer membrane lipoprotein n=1 Tax=Galbibacter sp. PAP.153 TaxID=3104623 RepID=UPI00300B5A6F